MNDPNQPKPKIDYPCQWGFKVIGNDEESVRQAIQDCLRHCLAADNEERPVEIGGSRLSGGGKYVSVGLAVEVKSEEERNVIFRALADRPEIRMVL